MTVHPRHLAPGLPERTRPYDVAWVDGAQPTWEVRDLPALPALEAAVSILGRGAHVDVPGGTRAIEDLAPGDLVEGLDGPVPLDWIGTCDFEPDDDRPALFRIESHAFGAGRPAAPTLLGGGAHVLVEGEATRAMIGAPRAFAPVEAGEDGMAVTRLQPAGVVTLYGLACAGTEAVRVGGLAVATWHPARAAASRLSSSGLSDLARLCPPVAREGFGPARIPQMTLTEAREVLLA
ncbi:Hint domain-containing protein [Jannaschia sp. Os4]|uniref:Hint domain-containing protein n=1 Tax=Jannaschia sp. Os4 TaxID=2807617 RepID=UPI00193A00B4|nr:Hint domain-containing protein [Jannaschia sp. Os4]MBM2577383.1 Hint domain-containing protein [Jannaschia sp. Os4]